MRIYKGSLVKLKIIKRNVLYVLEGKTSSTGVTLLTNTEDKTLRWHKCMRHINDNRLHELDKQGLLYGDKVTSMDLCEDCLAGT